MALESTLNGLRLMNIKPNFSLLSREYKKDRHTIRKMYEQHISIERRQKNCYLDAFKDQILTILYDKSVSIKACYFYLKNERIINCGYNTFKWYVRSKNLKNEARKFEPHPLYETCPGDQLQVDWVEDLTINTRNEGPITFNLFSATLGYSRLHYFEFTWTKCESNFKRCVCSYLKHIGGMPERITTDNMSAIVYIDGNYRKNMIQLFSLKRI